MPEPITPLRTDHVFVLQLQKRRGFPESCRAGRVEHLSTGEAARFTTTTEFWSFVDKVLAELKRRENDQAVEQSEP
jgi:hypothetical protein